MTIKIRQYRPSDKNTLIKFMDDFQDHFVAIDTMKRVRNLLGYSQVAVRRCLAEVNKNQGIIYIAEDSGKPIGFIAGIINKPSEEDSLSQIPTKSAKITKLYIGEEYRGQGVGKALMGKMENYLKESGCDIVLLDVFEPNKSAHSFYSKLGYQNRMIYMIKGLS